MFLNFTTICIWQNVGLAKTQEIFREITIKIQMWFQKGAHPILTSLDHDFLGQIAQSSISLVGHSSLVHNRFSPFCAWEWGRFDEI